MLTSFKNFSIYQWLLFLFAFTIPFFPLARILLSVFTLLFIIERVVFYVSDKKNFRFNTSGIYAILFLALFFAAHLVGVLYTENKTEAWLDIQSKLLLLIMPLLFLFHEPLSKAIFKPIVFAFILGCLCMSGYLLVASIIQYVEYKKFTFFLYTELSKFHHPTYLSMYLNWAVIALAYFLFQDYYSRLRWFFIVLFIFFSLFIMLLESKIGIVILALTMFFIIALCIYQKKIKVAVIITSVLLVVFVSFVAILPARNNRVYTTVMTFLGKGNKKEDSAFTRFVIWENALSVFYSHWVLGVGTGDIEQALEKSFIASDAKAKAHYMQNDYNAHNQFIQTLMALGIVGGLLLVSSLVVPVYLSIVHRNYLYLIFLFIVVFNLFFECMLERQAGIAFYAFFNILLLRLDRLNSSHLDV